MRAIGRRSSVEQVIAQLNEQLAAGEWKPGERIPTEQALSSELDVSRPVVREAVRALVHLGALESRQGAGTYVISTADPMPLLRQVRLADIQDVFEVQLGCDMQAARLAAHRRDDADLRNLAELLRRRDAAREPEHYGAADAEFHLAIVRAARNPVLLEMYRYLLDRLKESLAEMRAQGVVESGPRAHQELFRAVEGGDPDAAERAARSVIELSLESLRQALEERRRDQSE